MKDYKKKARATRRAREKATDPNEHTNQCCAYSASTLNDHKYCHCYCHGVKK